MLKIEQQARKRKKKKETQIPYEHYWHGLGKDIVLCSAPPNGCRDITSYLEDNIREALQWKSAGCEAEVCTPGVLLKY